MAISDKAGKGLSMYEIFFVNFGVIILCPVHGAFHISHLYEGTLKHKKLFKLKIF